MALPPHAQLWDESLMIFRTLGDQSGIAEILNLLGWSLFHQGDPVSAHTYFTDSLARFRSLENQRGITIGLNSLAATIRDPVAAQDYIEESLRLSRTVGHLGTHRQCAEQFRQQRSRSERHCAGDGMLRGEFGDLSQARTMVA